MTRPNATCPTCSGGIQLVPEGGTLRCPECQVRFALPVAKPAAQLPVPAEPRTGDDSDPAIDETIDSPSNPPDRSSATPSLTPMDSYDGRALPFSKEFLANYEPVSFLGKGAMGAVFLMKQVKLSRLVAVKVVNEEAVTADVASRLMKEAQTLASLNHSNILAIYDVGQDGDVPYMISEYVEGEPLNDRLRREPALTLSQSLRIVIAVLDGMRAAHKQGIVHRDMKPSNIFLTSSGKPKIGDFGLAKSQNAPSGTAVGRILGTPGYMSPEQCRGRGATPASDIYSLGIVLYELLTGNRPFTGPSLLDFLRQHTTETPPKLRALLPEAPVELEAIIARALEKDPAARFRSSTEMKRAVQEVFKATTTSRDAGSKFQSMNQAPSSEAAKGARFANRYELVRILGAGGMGQVWLAKDEVRRGVEVALKLLPPELWRDPESRANIVSEANIALRLTHPDIVRLINIEPGDSPFLVMELVLGPTMTEELARRRQEFLGPLTPRECLPVIEPVARGLDYAHAMGVIHRDVKPSNLILLMEGTTIKGAKLADFGIAAELANFRTRLTGAVPAGTLSYMSPEQVTCQPLDARSDVYALGATLYQMLTGHPPFVGSDIAGRIKNEAVPDLDNVSAEVSRVVRASLAKEPDDRPATAGDLARMLREAVGDTVSSDTQRIERQALPIPIVDDPTPQTRRSTSKTAKTAALYDLSTGKAIEGGGDSGSGRVMALPARVRRALLLAMAMLVASEFAWPLIRDRVLSPPEPTVTPVPTAAPTGIPTKGPAQPETPAPTRAATSPPTKPLLRGKLLIEGADRDRKVLSETGEVLGLTPGPIDLDEGDHRLTVSPGPNDQDDRRVLSIAANKTATWRIFREPKRVKLPVVTEPAGAEIQANGVPRGKAPLELDLAAGREVSIIASVPGYVSELQKLMVNAEELRTVRLSLRPEDVQVTLESVPSNAAIMAGGVVYLGTTPRTVKVPPGQTVQYLIQLAEHKSVTVTGLTTAGVPLRLHATLERDAPVPVQTPSAAPMVLRKKLSDRQKQDVQKLLNQAEKYLSKEEITEDDIAKAHDLARKAAEIDPYSIPIKRMLASCFIGEGNPQQAVNVLEDAVQVDPSDLDVKNMLALILIQNVEQVEKGTELARQTTVENSLEAEYWDTYGRGLVKLKKKKDAIDAFEQALKLKPDHDHAKIGLGEAKKLK